MPNKLDFTLPDSLSLSNMRKYHVSDFRAFLYDAGGALPPDRIPTADEAFRLMAPVELISDPDVHGKENIDEAQQELLRQGILTRDGAYHFNQIVKEHEKKRNPSYMRPNLFDGGMDDRMPLPEEYNALKSDLMHSAEVMTQKYEDYIASLDPVQDADEIRLAGLIKDQMELYAAGVMPGDLEDTDYLYSTVKAMRTRITFPNLVYSYNKDRPDPVRLEQSGHSLKELAQKLKGLGMTEYMSAVSDLKMRQVNYLYTAPHSPEEKEAFRQQEIEAYRQIEAYATQMTSLTREKHQELLDDGFFGNKYDEFTTGPRGPLHVISDVQFRIRALEAGVAPEALDYLAVVNTAVSELERRGQKEKAEELKTAINDMLDPSRHDYGVSDRINFQKKIESITTGVTSNDRDLKAVLSEQMNRLHDQENAALQRHIEEQNLRIGRTEGDYASLRETAEAASLQQAMKQKADTMMPHLTMLDDFINGNEYRGSDLFDDMRTYTETLLNGAHAIKYGTLSKDECMDLQQSMYDAQLKLQKEWKKFEPAKPMPENPTEEEKHSYEYLYAEMMQKMTGIIAPHIDAAVNDPMLLSVKTLGEAQKAGVKAEYDARKEDGVAGKMEEERQINEEARKKYAELMENKYTLLINKAMQLKDNMPRREDATKDSIEFQQVGKTLDRMIDLLWEGKTAAQEDNLEALQNVQNAFQLMSDGANNAYNAYQKKNGSIFKIIGFGADRLRWNKDVKAFFQNAAEGDALELSASEQADVDKIIEDDNAVKEAVEELAEDGHVFVPFPDLDPNGAPQAQNPNDNQRKIGVAGLAQAVQQKNEMLGLKKEENAVDYAEQMKQIHEAEKAEEELKKSNVLQ